jgi:tRNA (adenine22-N1)-methyltransferase
MKIPLSNRLLACASFVRSGDRVADIGCDHGYLGIHLLKENIASFIIASDINEGPLQSAKRNAEKFGYSEQMAFYLSDGVRNIPREFDVLVCAGMGGDTMIHILENAPWLKKEQYRMILQCQSKRPELRKYLYENGFSIVDELIVDDEKIYQIVCAEYTGDAICANEYELMFGKINIKRRDELLFELLRRTKKVFEERIKGKLVAGADIGEEEKMIKNIDMIINGEI